MKTSTVLANPIYSNIHNPHFGLYLNRVTSVFLKNHPRLNEYINYLTVIIKNLTSSNLSSSASYLL